MNSGDSAKANYYPDILLFITLIPMISAINYFLTYSNIQFNLYLLFRFSVDTIQGYGAWLLVRWIILSLDKTIPFSDQITRRLIIQITTTTFAGILFIALTTEALSYLVKGRGAPMSFYTLDLVIISIWFLVINAIYTGLYFYHQWRQLITRNQQVPGSLVVKTGKLNYKIDHNNICGFFVEGEYLVVVENTGKKHYVDQSLDKIETTLPVENFFRLNRQFLLHRHLIQGFKRGENGKINVLVSREGFPPEIAVSRLKAPAFRKWFMPTADITTV